MSTFTRFTAKTLLGITGLLGIATGADAQNIALGKTVAGSSNFNVGLYPHSNLVDGDFATFAHTDNTAAFPTGEWLQVDLGADYYIDSVVIGCRPGSNRIRRFMLVTWPGSLPSLGADPSSYPNNSLYNRLVYTDPTGTGSPFGQTAGNPNVPGTAGQSLGPVFPANQLHLHIGVHKARYVLLLNLQDDYLDPTELQVYAAPPPVRAFTNGGFEQGSVSTGVLQVREDDVVGWSTTEAVAMYAAVPSIPAGGSFIELWQTGALGVPSYSGSYFAELNAFTNGMLEQQPICVQNGESFNFSFAHRGRDGVDVMRLRIDDVDVAEFTDNNAQGAPHTFFVLTPATTTVSQGATTATGWTPYSGTWTNTSGANKIVTFGYRAISSNGGAGSLGAGNFLDAVTLTSLNAFISLDQAAATGPETDPSADLPKLLVNGTIAAPATIQVNITGGTAVRGTDYTTTPAAGLITVTIPPGNYDGTDATAISLAPYIQINTDAVTPEASETIDMTIQAPSAGLLIADAVSCGTAISSTVYTITDAPPPLPVTLSVFQAMSAGRDGQLYWEVKEQRSFSHYEVERSVNGRDFESAGLVLSNGETSGSYSFRDVDAASRNAVVYYRLKMADQNGRYNYSTTRSIRFAEGVEVQVKPNPVKGGSNALITVSGSQDNVYQVDVLSATGQYMGRYEVKGGTELELGTGTLPRGLYLLRVSGAGQYQTVKLLVE